MSAGDRLVETITERGRYVIAAFLVLTLVIGAGATAIDQRSSLDQFETDSEAAEKQAIIEKQYGGDEDTTSVQVFVTEGNVLERESLIETLKLQRDFREDQSINETLVDEPFRDLSSVVATTAIRREEAAALEAESEKLNATAATLTDLLNETREIQGEYDRLNASHRRGEIDDANYSAEAERLDGEFASVRERAREALTDDQYESFAGLLEETRRLQHERFLVQSRYERGEIDEETRDAELEELGSSFEAVYGAIYEDVLGDAFARLEERSAALREGGESPSIEEQIEQLESMNDSEVESLVGNLLEDGGSGGRGLYAFLPTDYEPGSTEADARMLIVTQESEGTASMEGSAPERIVDSQLAMADRVEQRFGDGAFVFGPGIVSDEIDRSLADSMLIVMPLALLFVAFVLTVAYRDVLDILVGLFGIGFVLAWTFGFMGWAGISFNQIMIAVPVLLVGLSIDYAIHLFMRHREQRTAEDRSTRSAMAVVLGGLGVAFVWVTATAVIGFLSNLISPVGPLRDFGAASAVGITSALLVFGVLVPAVKVELDALLEARGSDRRKRAFGTGGGRIGDALALGQRAAGRIPWVVVAVTLLLTLGGAYGATQVDTSFQQEDFIADDPSPLLKSLPAPFAPGDYGAKADLEYVNENFLRQDSQAQILVEEDGGDLTDDGALERIAAAEDAAAEKDAVLTLSSGDPGVRSAVSVTEAVAARNESFNQTVAAADTDGDGIPDENLETVYDELFAVAPDRASEVIYRSDEGEYETTRLVISTRGDAASSEVSDQMNEVAAGLEGDGLAATATGQVIVFHVVEQELFDTVIDSLLITLVAVFVFLMLAYRWVHGSAVLGAITLLPIVFAVAWILGTMYLLDISFNVMTGTITSLTIGLGVAYNIHMTERYVLERERGLGTFAALKRSVTGTGGALLGSAATTVGGFGVLIFAILPPLQQFGLITGLTITYAFAGSVFVLPSFLALWTRYVGPQGGFPAESTTTEPTAAADGRGAPTGSADDGGER